MKNRNKLIMRVAAAIVTVTSIFFFAPWQAAFYYLVPLPTSVKHQVDESIEKNIDGIIVYVQKGAEQAEYYAGGWHNRDKKIPANPHALFKIASIGKLYNATAVAKLVAKERLSLDKTLAEYLPELASRIEFSERITLRMMVQHRSGIPNYTDQDGFSWSQPNLTKNGNLDLILDLPADFKPGSDYGYSNTNYLLLNRIISKTLGYAQTQFINDEILKPLVLKNTFFSVGEVDMEKLMSGYYVGYNDDFKELDQGFVATAEDVGIFLRALNDGTLLTDKEQAIYSSIYKYEHTGWVLGYYSIARYHKDIDTVVVQFVNTVGNNTLLMSDVIYSRIVNILRKENEGVISSTEK